MDIFNSRSIISAENQYIFRANPNLAADKSEVFFEYAHFTTKSSCTTSPQTRIRAVNLSVMCDIYAYFFLFLSLASVLYHSLSTSPFSQLEYKDSRAFSFKIDH